VRAPTWLLLVGLWGCDQPAVKTRDAPAVQTRERQAVEPVAGACLESCPVVPTRGATLAAPKPTGGALDRVRLVIPPGALAGDQPVTVGVAIGRPRPFPDARPVGPTLRLAPDGQTFSQPVTLTLPFEPAAAAGAKVAVLVRGQAGAERVAPSSVDEAGRTVTIALSHFSEATPVVTPAPAPPAPPSTNPWCDRAGKPDPDWLMQKWVQLANMNPSPRVTAMLAALPDPATPYQFGAGWGDLRTDFFGIDVCLPPSLSADTLLARMRDDPDGLADTPMTPSFKTQVGWAAAPEGRRLGDVVNLDILGPENGAIAYIDVDLSDGEYCVVTVQNSRWRSDSSGSHPVSGVRCWGYRDVSPCGTLFYTVGIESASVWGTGGVGSVMQRLLWDALVEGIGEEVKKAGGSTCLQFRDGVWHWSVSSATKAKQRAGEPITRADLEETGEIDTVKRPPGPADCQCCKDGPGGKLVLGATDFEVYDDATKDFRAGTRSSTPTSDWEVGDGSFHYASRKDGFQLKVTWDKMPAELTALTPWTMNVAVEIEGPRRAAVALTPVVAMDVWRLRKVGGSDGAALAGPNAYKLSVAGGPDVDGHPVKAAGSMQIEITPVGIGATVKDGQVVGGSGKLFRGDKPGEWDTYFLELQLNGMAKARWTYRPEAAARQ
jgi:hypothetical protein